MTKRELLHEMEEPPIAALLFIRDIEHRVAPDWLGGQSENTQMRIVRAQAKRECLDLKSFYVSFYMRSEYRPDDRLASMLRIVEGIGLQRLYVTGVPFAHDSHDTVMAYTAALKAKGAELIICEDE